MTIIHALILSVVEGITEFLPISSTGHLVLVSSLLKIAQSEFVKSFEIIIQLGAILAVVATYHKRIIGSTKDWPKLIVAFIPTGVLGLVFYKFIKSVLLGNNYVTVLALLIGGVAILLLENKYHEDNASVGTLEEVSYKSAFLIGLIQSISMIPGVSRSGATIFGGMFLGLKRSVAVEFSFLLAIPTMAAATGLDLVKTHINYTSSQYMILAIGLLGSGIAAFVSIRFLLKYISGHNFKVFGIYRIVLAIVFALLFLRR